MTSMSQKRANIISQRLELLQDQGYQLNKAVGHYISQITQVGQSWTEGGDNQMGFLELCQMVDSAVDLLLRKCEEISENQLSQTSCDISDTQDALNQEQEKRLHSLEKQLQKLSTAQDRMKEEMESQTELTEKKLQKITTAQDRMKEEMESQTELTEKLVHVPDQLESVTEKLDVFDARIGRIMDDCRNKHQDIEHVTHELADKVMANTETFQVISKDQDPKMTLLGELEARMQTLEGDIWRNGKEVQKKVEKGDTNLRILCQMLNDRLTPLEQLRTCLNDRASTRDENIRQLTQVMQEVAVMSPRLQQLELKSSRTRCGFTALARSSQQHLIGYTVRPYNQLYCNVGGNFDANSGIFTAPVDGLYVAVISVGLCENDSQSVGVKHKKQSLNESSIDVCICRAVKGTQACNVAVVDMKAESTYFYKLPEVH